MHFNNYISLFIVINCARVGTRRPRQVTSEESELPSATMWFFLALVNVASPIFLSVLPLSFSVPAGEALACSYFKREQFMFSHYVSLPLFTLGGYLRHVRFKMRHASIFEVVLVTTCHCPIAFGLYRDPSFDNFLGRARANRAISGTEVAALPVVDAVCCVGRLRTPYVYEQHAAAGRRANDAVALLPRHRLFAPSGLLHSVRSSLALAHLCNLSYLIMCEGGSRVGDGKMGAHLAQNVFALGHSGPCILGGAWRSVGRSPLWLFARPSSALRLRPCLNLLFLPSLPPLRCE